MTDSNKYIFKIKYYRLFDLLARKGYKKTDLITLTGISSPTLAKLSKGDTVTTEVISKICDALNCQPGDIMEYIPDNVTMNNNESVSAAANK